MPNLKKFGKVILFDSLAGLCFIGVAIFGWLPGPGGLPLLLAGLALLAVNHDWAERWLETAKHKGKTMKSTLFPDVAWIRHSYDVLSITIFAAATYIIFNVNNRIIGTLCVSLIIFSSFVFLVNRKDSIN